MLLLVSKTNINSLHFSTTKMINLEAHDIMMKTSILVATTSSVKSFLEKHSKAK